MEDLQGLGGDNVHHAILDARDHGLPQSRPRLYICGVRGDMDDGTFVFPPRLDRVDIDLVLDPPVAAGPCNDLPPHGQATARANVLSHLSRLAARGDSPDTHPWIIDCDASAARSHAMLRCSPCLTRAHYQGHWISCRGRRLSLSGSDCGSKESTRGIS